LLSFAKYSTAQLLVVAKKMVPMRAPMQGPTERNPIPDGVNFHGGLRRHLLEGRRHQHRNY
jgi:hypothetical protein